MSFTLTDSVVVPRPLHRAWLEIDGDALRKNVAVVRRRVGPKVALMGMVKANAYGHGYLPVARELLAAGVSVLAVSDVDELRLLRRAGIAAPVLLCSAALPGEYDEIVALHGWPTLSTLAEARLLDAAAQKAKRVAEAHFKVDTGMNRLGLRPDPAAEELRRVLALPRLRVMGLYTHCARADDDAAFTARQTALFRAWRGAFPGLPWHLANSAGLLRDRATFAGATWVRPGLALYGLPPRPADRKSLRPVLAWKTRVTLVRDGKRGETVGYGATYRLPRAQRLATLAIGYGDGYPRLLSNRADVLIGGKRCPIRGRVTMDQIVVDASRAPDVKAGDEAVLLGRQGRDEISADELARHAGTISYEIVTGTSALPERLPRIYRNFTTLVDGN